MSDNSNIGLNTQSNVMDLHTAKNKLRMVIVDHDYFSNGITFDETEGQSSNHLFGNGQWKRKTKEAFGDEVFNENVQMYGRGNAGDLFLLKIKTDKIKDFNIGDKVEIVDNNNFYSGIHKVLAKAEDGIIFMLPFKGNTSGVIKNISRRDGLHKAIHKYHNFIENNELFSKGLTADAPINEQLEQGVLVIPMEPEVQIIEPEPIHVTEEKKADEVFVTEKPVDTSAIDEMQAKLQMQKERNRKILKAILITGAIILTGVIIYKIYKKQTQK